MHVAGARNAVSVHAHQLLRLLYPAPRPAPGLTIVWRQSQVIPPLVVVGAGKSRKEQRPLASFFSPTTGPSPASHGPLRTPGSSARLQAKNAVTAVATQFFLRNRGAPPCQDQWEPHLQSGRRVTRLFLFFPLHLASGTSARTRKHVGMLRRGRRTSEY